jgi:hypothetical protein
MTQLIDEIKVRITLKHDEVNSSVYGGPDDLRAWLKNHWNAIGPLIFGSADKGTMSMPGILVEWQNGGLEEVPEEGGGDN